FSAHLWSRGLEMPTRDRVGVKMVGEHGLASKARATGPLSLASISWNVRFSKSSERALLTLQGEFRSREPPRSLLSDAKPKNSDTYFVPLTRLATPRRVGPPRAGEGGLRAYVDGTPLFSLRENAIAKEPGLSYPEPWPCVSRLGASMVAQTLSSLPR